MPRETKGNFLDFLKSFAPGGETPIEAWSNMFSAPDVTYEDSVRQSVPFESGSSAEKEHQRIQKKIENGINNFKPTEEHVTEANNSSASKVAEEANRLTSEWFKESMEYNAEQARLNREFQQSSADKAMQFESQEAEKYREWLKMMSDTQYQRAVADLKEAHLNPILLAQHLSPASTPSGNSARGISASGSSASVSQTSAAKAEVDLSSRARLIEAYLQKETTLTVSERQSISNLLSALIGLAR